MNEKLLRAAVATILVLGTWALWAYKSFYGETVNALLFSLAIVMVLAAARVVFGPGAFAKALDAVGTLREAAQAPETEDDEQ